MSRHIHVDLPENVNGGDIALFTPHVDYHLDDLKVLYLQEAFVTYTGLCVDETGVRKESYHGDVDQLDRFINDAVVQFKQALEDPTKLIELDDDQTYLLIHHPWASNYWHWMSEVILRVWMVRSDTHNMVLILPESLRNVTFVKQSLAVFQFKRIYYIPDGHHLLVRSLCVPEVKKIPDSYYPETLRDIRGYYLDKIQSKRNLPGKKLYISRRQSEKRKVINEDEVESMLRKYDFDCVCNEDFDFNEQVSLYANATHVVSIHGAGLTNMMFMKENSSVLELHKKRTNDYDWHSLAFWYMSNALGFNYHQQVCEPDNPMSTFFAANFVVDIELLEKNIRNML